MSLTINNKPIGPVAFGLMRLTARPDKLSDEQLFAALKTAIDSGCNLLNGGEFYGSEDNNSLQLLNKYFKKYPEDASKVVVNIKGGMDLKTVAPTGSREAIRASIDRCLSGLGDTCFIDQWEPARKDLAVDYEQETLATIQEYVDAGKIGGIALSEVNANTIRSAMKTGKFTITALETELSLFHTDPVTDGTLATCAEFGIPVLAHSAMGRGFLGGNIKSLADLKEGDMRGQSPQFQGDNLTKNIQLAEQVELLAKEKGVAPGQIALSWLVAISRRPGMPTVIPLPGSSDPGRIKENATLVELTEEDLKKIDEILAKYTTAGARYPAFLNDQLNK